jgi:hypothetical protein
LVHEGTRHPPEPVREFSGMRKNLSTREDRGMERGKFFLAIFKL